MVITQNLYDAYCTPKYVFDQKYFESWYPKIHSPRNYLQSFYVTALIEELCTNKNYTLAVFQNSISKNKISYYKGTMNNGALLSSSDSEMASKVKKNCRATFEKNEDELLLSQG